MGSWQRYIDFSVSVTVGVLALVLIWTNVDGRLSRPARPVMGLPQVPVGLGTAVRGSPSAKVGLVAFSDFECPFCGDFARRTLPKLEEKYIGTGMVRIGFRHFPNETTHRRSLFAAQAAACAAEQEEFWPMHDRLFRAGSSLDAVSVRSYAAELPLDQFAFRKCLDAVSQPSVDRDLAEAIALKLSGTPAFFVGVVSSTGDSIHVTDAVQGDQRVDVFISAIERAVKVGSAR